MEDHLAREYNRLSLLHETIVKYLKPQDRHIVVTAFMPSMLHSFDDDSVFRFTSADGAKCGMNLDGDFYLLPPRTKRIERRDLSHLIKTYSSHEIQSYLERMLGKIVSHRLLEGKIEIVPK